VGAARKPKLYLHRILMGSPEGMDIDHRDGNGLNNCRSNLRVATRAQNSANRGRSAVNTSGFKGVFWNADRGKWYARISVAGKATKRGYFETPELAAAAYSELVAQQEPDFGKSN